MQSEVNVKDCEDHSDVVLWVQSLSRATRKKMWGEEVCQIGLLTFENREGAFPGQGPSYVHPLSTLTGSVLGQTTSANVFASALTFVVQHW